MFFLTFRAKTSISEERIELYGAPGAIHSAKMTRPLYDDGTCVKLVGKFRDRVSSASQLMVNASLRQCCWNSQLLSGYDHYNLLRIACFLFSRFCFAQLLQAETAFRTEAKTRPWAFSTSNPSDIAVRD